MKKDQIYAVEAKVKLALKLIVESFDLNGIDSSHGAMAILVLLLEIISSADISTRKELGDHIIKAVQLVMK